MSKAEMPCSLGSLLSGVLGGTQGCLGQVGTTSGERSLRGLLGREAAQAAEWEGGDQPRSFGLRGRAGLPGPGEGMLV